LYKITEKVISRAVKKVRMDVSLYLNVLKILLLCMFSIIVFMDCFLLCALTIGNLSLL